MTECEVDLVGGAIGLMDEKGISLNEPTTLSVEAIYKLMNE